VRAGSQRLEGLAAVLRTLDGGQVVRTVSGKEQTEVTLGPEDLDLWLGVHFGSPDRTGQPGG